MAENTNETTHVITDVPEDSAPTRLQAFVAKHPRASKVVAITGATLAAVGVVQVARTVKSNKGHLEAAGDHAVAALDELSSTVDPASPEA